MKYRGRREITYLYFLVNIWSLQTISFLFDIHHEKWEQLFTFKNLRKINQGWPSLSSFVTILHYVKTCSHFYRCGYFYSTLSPKRLPSSVMWRCEICPPTFLRNVSKFLSSTWRHTPKDDKLYRYGLYKLTPRIVIPLWRISWTTFLLQTSRSRVYI
jgi:hypothetical protein